MPPFYSTPTQQNPTLGTGLYSGHCDPNQRFFGAFPVTVPGLNGLLGSQVTNFVNYSPEVYLFDDTAFTAAAVGDDCAGGVTQANLKKCLTVAQPFGYISVATEKFDLATAEDRQNACARALFQWQNGNGFPAGTPEGLFAGVNNASNPNVAFIATYQIWRAVNGLGKLMRKMAITGNASVASAFPNHIVDYNGALVLLNNDAAIYPCVSDATFNPSWLMMNWVYSTSPVQNYISASDVTKKAFYLELSRRLRCLIDRGLPFGVSRWAMIVPKGSIDEFADVFTIGYNNAIAASTNSGSELMRMKESILTTLTVNMQGVSLTLVEDDTLPLSPNFGTADPTKRRTDLLVVPLDPVLGEEFGFIEYLKWADAANDPGTNGTWITDGGRFKIVQKKDGSCYQWFVQARPRLRIPYPFLSLRIRDVGINAVLC